MKNGSSILAAMVFIGATLLLVPSSCNNSGSTTSKRPAKLHRDTTRAVIVYLAADINDVKYGPSRRVVADSLMWVTTDTVTQKKIWTNDTAYLITYDIPVDSNIARRYNLPLLDSNGKKYSAPFEILTHKRFVRSGWENLDSAINQLRRLK